METHMLIYRLHPLFAMTRRRLWLALLIPVLFSGLAGAQEYTITDLGTLGGSSSAAVTVNNWGQVVGTAAVAGDSHSDPFLFSAGKMTDVWTGGTQFGGTTVAINDSSNYVVNYILDAAGNTESFIWTGTIWADLGTGGATGMNANDTVVGNGPKGYWVYSNFLLNTSPGYSIPSGGVALAYSVNNAGWIAGECPKANPDYPGDQNGCVFGPNISFVLQDAGLGQVGPFPPYAIASDGATCGENGVSQFAVWSKWGTQTYAVSLDGDGECAGLDDYGNAVGFGPPNDFAFNNDGFIYDPIHKLRDLNTLVPQFFRKGHAVSIQEAISISDAGFIAADCAFETPGNGTAVRACLLTPNWAEILHDHIMDLPKVDPRCVQCKTELEPEAKSLPTSFTDLSTDAKKKALATLEKIESQLSALSDGDRINEQEYVLLLHDTEMALQTLVNRPR
jgi:hypothetical protein